MDQLHTAAAQSRTRAAASTGKSLPVSSRDPHIDVLKGIGMICVILTHMGIMDYLGYSFIQYLLVFSLPMFFFISGYLFSTSSDATMKFGPYVAKKAVALLVPYVIFFVISFVWTQTVYAAAIGAPVSGFDIDWANVAAAFFLAGEYLFDLALVPAPLWFLHALFFSSLVFFFIMKLKNNIVLLVVALALSFAALPLQSALGESPIWLFSLLPVSLFFMICGHLFRVFISLPPEKEPGVAGKNRAAVGGFLSMLFILAGFFCMQEGRGDMWSITSYWYFPGALASIIGFYMLSRCTDNKVLQFVGANSLLYLGLHPLILALPLFSGLPAWFAERGFDGIIPDIGYFIISFLATTVLVLVAMGIQRAFRSARRRKKTAPAEDFLE